MTQTRPARQCMLRFDRDQYRSSGTRPLWPGDRTHPLTAPWAEDPHAGNTTTWKCVGLRMTHLGSPTAARWIAMK